MDLDHGPDVRPLPWVACDLPLEPTADGALPPGRVTALAMDAVRVAGLSETADGDRVKVAFRIPGQPTPIVLHGRARRTSKQPSLVELAIESLEGAGEQLYQQHVLSRVGAEAMDRQVAALTAATGRLVPLADPIRIQEVLHDSLAYKADTLVQGQHPASPVRGLLTRISSSELLLQLESGEQAGPLAGTRVRCSLLSRHGPYLFEAEVRGSADRQIRLSLPDKLHQYEKRAERRTALPSGQQGLGTETGPHEAAGADVADRIVITLPPAYGAPMERALIDVSEAGAAFRSYVGDPLFLPGTPLPGVVLVRNGRAGSPRPAEVRQVTLEGDRTSPERTFRVGLALDVERARGLDAVTARAGPAASPQAHDSISWLDRLTVVARWSFMAARSRLPRLRQRPASRGPLVNVLRYRNRAAEEIVALVNSTRPLGRGPRLRGPLVVIPPAFGKTKETYCALALVLTETFRRHGRDVLVVRYDGVRSLGESHKDPENAAEGRQMMQYTLSQGAADLLATLDYFHGRPWFWPTHTVVISFSLAALPSRRAILDDPFARITHWISVMGAPDAQEVFFNATGGIDLIGGHQLGVRFGVMPVLGHLGDVDRFAEDAIAAGLATLRDARRDLGRIRIPVTWFVGRDDRWVRPERVRDVMSVAAPAPRRVIELPIGHNMPVRAEALASFEASIGHLWTLLYGEAPHSVWFDEASYRRAAALERERLPRRRIADPRDYWERYLLGEDGRGVGFDLWATTPAYRELMDLQRQLLDISEGDVVADLGAGTGNFVEHLLERLVREGFRTSPRQLIVGDLVKPALELARKKTSKVLEGLLVPADFLEFRELNLETSRLRPIRRFVTREFTSLDSLRGLVDGLGDTTLDAWLATYDEQFHAWLRGATPDEPDGTRFAKLLEEGDLQVAVEFCRAARWVLGRLTPEDLRADLHPATASTLLADPRRARADQLRFERLRLAGSGIDDPLPFLDASLDKALLSLVVSYLFNPGETLREVNRALRPGGRVVASTIRPGADLSRLVEELVEQVGTDRDVAQRFGLARGELTAALQRYLNQAATIHDLEEGGVFHFFSREELTGLLEGAGFEQVKVFESFGRPPLIFVGVGVKR